MGPDEKQQSRIRYLYLYPFIALHSYQHFGCDRYVGIVSYWKRAIELDKIKYPNNNNNNSSNQSFLIFGH